MRTLVFPVEFNTNKGGVSQSIISLVHGLSRFNNYRLIVVSPSGSEMASYPFPNNVLVITSKASDWKISKTHFIRSSIIAFELYFKLRKFINKDTLFVTNHSGSSYMVSLLPIIQVNELYVNRGGSFSSKGFGDILMKRKLRNGRIKYAVAISSHQSKILVENGMPVDRVFVINNGLPLPSQEYVYRPLNAEELWISTMGFFSRLKGQHIGVELIKLLRDSGINAKLNMYGIPDSDIEYNRELEKKIEELGLKEYVYHRGFVVGEELFSQTDILISFSKSEGFGRSLVEAMLRKIPIIAFRGAGGPIDITGDGKYGHLVQRNEATEYLTVIQNLLQHPLYNQKNVMDSYHFAVNMFTEEVMVQKYLSMFDRIFSELA